MTSHNQSQINRLEREIANLDKDTATEAKKEASLIGRISRAEDAINKARNMSTIQSKLREIERDKNELATTKKKQADISKKKAEKSSSLRDYQNRQAREDDKARKKIADEQRKLMREREAQERHVSSEARSRSLLMNTLDVDDGLTKEYDFFISYASEDKDTFVRPLAKFLSEKGAKVWYDDFILKVGDSLRQQIEDGLRKSRFGIVILSEHFFNKQWTQRELNGLFQLETQRQSVILPIWHKLSKDEVIQYSPILSDKVALNTSSMSIDDIACTLIQRTQSQ